MEIEQGIFYYTVNFIFCIDNITRSTLWSKAAANTKKKMHHYIEESCCPPQRIQKSASTHPYMPPTEHQTTPHTAPWSKKSANPYPSLISADWKLTKKIQAKCRSWSMWWGEMNVPISTPDTHRLPWHTTNQLGRHRKWQPDTHRDDTFWKRTWGATLATQGNKVWRPGVHS